MKHVGWLSLFFVGAVVGIFGYAVVVDNKLGSIKVGLPGGANVEMNLEESGELKFLDIIKTLFEDKSTKLATKGVLEGQYGFFEAEGAELLSMIRNNDSQVSGLRGQLVNMLSKFEGPFTKKKGFNFRDVSDPATIDEMNEMLGNKHPVATKIQDLCNFNEDICKKPGKFVYVTFPGTLKAGSGAVCRESRLHGSNVVLQNPKLHDKIIVITLRNSFFPCIDKEAAGTGNPRLDKENVIQISDEDRNELFPNLAGGGIYEALMFPNPPGTEAVI